MKQLLAFLFVLTLLMGLSMQVQAELFNRGTDTLGNRLIYDSDLNITWYDYTNDLGLDLNIWQNQTNWASALTVNFSGTIFDDWRLPSVLDGQGFGYNRTSSEMGHLFYAELVNKGYCSTAGTCPQAGWGLLNKSPFLNLQPFNYWSASDTDAPRGSVWTFSFYDGRQGSNLKYNENYALAVRSGDVVAAPEPVSSILFLTGGATLLGRKYIRKKR